MNSCKKTTLLAAGVLLGLSSAALAQGGGTGMMGSGMSGSMSSGMSSGTIDYHILSNPFYDYVDLQQASARGLSDSQVAVIAKIAQKTGMSFRTVSAAVERGMTFPMLAMHHNLRLVDVYDVDDQKQEIANYKMAYESIGSLSGGMSGSMSNGMSGMSGSGMSGTMGTGSTGTMGTGTGTTGTGTP